MSHYTGQWFRRENLDWPPNGVRYPRVGGTRKRRFDGTSFKPRKLPENAATPTRRVHAVLGVFGLSKTRRLIKDDTANLTTFYMQLTLWQLGCNLCLSTHWIRRP